MIDPEIDLIYTLSHMPYIEDCNKAELCALRDKMLKVLRIINKEIEDEM